MLLCKRFNIKGQASLHNGLLQSVAVFTGVSVLGLLTLAGCSGSGPFNQVSSVSSSAASIAISLTSPLAQLGTGNADTASVTCVVTMLDGTTNNGPCTYNTTNAAVATVSSSGEIVPAGAGTVSIRASALGISSPAVTFTVLPPPLQIVLTPANGVAGAFVQASCIVTLPDGASNNGPCTYVSDAPTVANANAFYGTIQTLSAGTANITATAPGGLAPVTTALTVTAPAAGVLASRAADFQHIWGTYAYLADTDADTSQLANDIQYTGIKQWRGDYGDPTVPNSALGIIAAAGVDYTAFPTAANGVTPDITATISNLKLMASNGALHAIESLNDPGDNTYTYNGVSSSGTFMPVAQWESAFYNAVKADPVLQNYPVYGSAYVGAEPDNVGLQFLTVPQGSGPKGIAMPDGTQFGDYVNVIANTIWKGVGQTVNENTDYFLDEGTSGLFDDHVVTWNGYFGYTPVVAFALPKVVTYFGWPITPPWGLDGYQLDEPTAGKNVVNGLLNAYMDGFELAAVATFYPGPMTSNATGQFPGYNIYAAPGQPFDAATYMHNLSVPISDTASNARTFTLGTLDYTLSGMPGPGRSLLLQRSDGAFLLILWSNATNWHLGNGNPSQNYAVTVAPANVTVNFATAVSAVNVYDVTQGETPISTSSGSTVTVPVADYPIVLEIKP